MIKRETDIVVIGAGPAGLSAAIQAAKAGAKVMLIDENALPGGQLFKQIHKFFGSREHQAGIRGMDIGAKLLAEVKELGVEVLLDTVVYGIFKNHKIAAINAKQHLEISARRIILATGAQENYMNFPGSTLPGVMGAGAAQTMINVHQVLPGKKVVMLGSGNVGLIVSYQLMQAGAAVQALVEAAPTIGGYGVHGAKIRRAGVPIYLGHTVLSANGTDHLTSVTLAAIDEKWQPIPKKAFTVEADTLCLAVGLNPMTELAWMAGCQFAFLPGLGGHIPKHDEDMATSEPDIYVAGDIAGVEEASSAMEEGNLAGLAAAAALGYIGGQTALEMKDVFRRRLSALRTGPFGEQRRQLKKELVAAGKGGGIR